MGDTTLCTHTPVMLNEVMTWLALKEGDSCVDGTVGRGGHTRAMLEAVGSSGRVLGLDRDEEALARAASVLSEFGTACTLVHGSFADIASVVREQNMDGVSGVLMDIGVSSEQLSDPKRGFSFQVDGPLDMRMDPSQGRSAADLLNELEEEALVEMLRGLGEERRAGRVARAIVDRRERGPITTTQELAEIVTRALGGRRGPRHPATKTFQALRIAVNEELEALKKGLEGALDVLGVGGRLAVITFHSLEDRLVKQTFRSHVTRWESLPQGGQKRHVVQPEVRVLTKKPVRPTDAEVLGNPRARSAKLRVVEKLETAA